LRGGIDRGGVSLFPEYTESETGGLLDGSRPTRLVSQWAFHGGGGEGILPEKSVRGGLKRVGAARIVD